MAHWGCGSFAAFGVRVKSCRLRASSYVGDFSHRGRFKNHPFFCRFGLPRASCGGSPNLPLFCLFCFRPFPGIPRARLHLSENSPCFCCRRARFLSFWGAKRPKMIEIGAYGIKTESFRTMEMSPAGCPEKVCNKKTAKKRQVSGTPAGSSCRTETAKKADGF